MELKAPTGFLILRSVTKKEKSGRTGVMVGQRWLG